MNGCEILLAGARLTARPSGALWWADARLLCVSDLHLCRAERVARRSGQILPPYETRETLGRLAAEIEATDPATVVCLGDSFDDAVAAAELCGSEARTLAAMQAARRWIWVEGNHEGGPLGLAGEDRPTFPIPPLTFRHIADPAAAPGEVTGHYHPKARLHLRGKSVSRPCFLHDEKRLILPAFGLYTGGLDARAPALARIFAGGARVLLTGAQVHEVPLAACG